MKTIYNTYVKMTSQEQCDRMKQLCIDYGLPYWDDDIAFEITAYKNEKSFFLFDISYNEFFIIDLSKNDLLENYNKVTEKEFIELIKTTKL